MITIRNIAARARGPRGCDGEVRCGCGSLLARVVDGEVELKCRRCKHVWRVPIDGSERGPAVVDRVGGFP
jgi:phage FluMu protein Com